MNNQSFITKLVLRLGLAKSERQVPAVLVAIAVLAVVVMFVAWPKSTNDVSQPSPAEIEATMSNR